MFVLADCASPVVKTTKKRESYDLSFYFSLFVYNSDLFFLTLSLHSSKSAPVHKNSNNPTTPNRIGRFSIDELKIYFISLLLLTLLFLFLFCNS